MPEVRVIREGSGSAENKNRIPAWYVKDNRLYVDGVHVFREHLNMKELQECFPDEYQDIYKGELMCPICEKRLQHANANTIRQHCRKAHAQWYDAHSPIFSLFDPKTQGFKPLLQAIRESLKEEVKSEADTKPNFEIHKGVEA